MRGVRDWVSEGATLEGDFFTDDAPPAASSSCPGMMMLLMPTGGGGAAEFGRAAPAWLERGMRAWFGRRRLSRGDDAPPLPPPYRPEEEAEDNNDNGYAQLAPILEQLF
jgi:hypothetical protein